MLDAVAFLSLFRFVPNLDEKVANFEYTDEAEVAEEEARQALEEKSSEKYQQDLLKVKYEEHEVEEFNTLGKGKRSHNKMVSVEDDDLAGLEDVSSEGEDDNYRADLTYGDTSTGTPSGRRPYKQRSHVDNMEPHPLMEGESRSFRVLGFSQNQRAAFVQILMSYGRLFWSHTAEEITSFLTFSDGVRK